MSLSADTLTPDALKTRIESALDTIRGYLQADGGDVRIHRITDDLTLELELMGSCSSCSMSPITMKAGVESAVLKAVPEIRRIVTLNTPNFPANA